MSRTVNFYQSSKIRAQVAICILGLFCIHAQGQQVNADWESMHLALQADPNISISNTEIFELNLEKAWALRMRQEHEEALSAIRSLRPENKDDEILSLAYLSMILFEMDSITSARQTTELCIAKINNYKESSTNDKIILSKALLAQCCDLSGDYVNSHKLFYECRNWLLAAPSSVAIYDVIDCLGQYYHRTNEIQAYSDILKQGYRLSQEGDLSYRNAVFEANLALIYYEIDSTDLCLDLTHKALNRFQKLNLHQREVQLLNNLSLVYFYQNNDSLAFSTIERALSVGRLHGTSLDRAYSHFNLANMHSYVSSTDSTLAYCDSTIYWAESSGNLYLLREIAALKSEVYKQTGDYIGSSQALEEYIDFNDSLLSKDKLSQLTRLQAEMDYQAMEIKLDREKLAKAEAELTSRKAQNTNLMLGGGLAILLLATGLLLQRIKSRRKLHENEVRLLESTREQEISQLIQTHKFEKLTATVQGEEKERDRLAKEIHDGVGGRLNGVALQLEAGKSPDALAEELRQIQKELRHIAHNISVPHFEENTLVELVQLHLHNLRAFNGLEITFVVFPPGQPLRLDHKLEINLYRMIQELLNNVVKHAQASTVDLQITQTTDYLEVMIEDNGLGFDPASAKWGIGLKNLRERVEVFEGSITFDSKKGRGTIAIIKIPTL
ncbi:MAG: hypothetical protein KDC12_11285 [Flavobacteriales bacterium]|nr:hypothetical protein [Flavobacteriales bacterium]